MKKIIAIGLLSLVSLSSTAGILDSRSQKAYDELNTCLKTLRKPDVCLEQLKRYSETAASVIQAKGSTAGSEKKRLIKMLNVFANSGDKYAAKAKAKADDKVAVKAISIYETVAAIQKSRRAEMLSKIDGMRGVANNRSLVLKLESRIEKLIAKLTADEKIPYEEISPVLESFSSQYEALPPRIIDRSVFLSNTINDWMKRYLNRSTNDLLNIELKELEERRDLYAKSQKLPVVQASIDEFIKDWNKKSIASISKRSNVIHEYLASAKRTSEMVVASGSISSITESDIDGLILDYSSMKDDFENIARLLSDDKNRWEELQQDFTPNKDIARDMATYEDIGELSYLYLDLNEGRVVKASDRLPTLASTQWIAPQGIVDFYKSGSGEIISNTLRQFKGNIEKQTAYLKDIVVRMKQEDIVSVVKSKLFPLIDNYMDDRTELLLNFDHIGGLLVASSDFYPGLTRYNDSIEETVKIAISDDGIEELHDFGGFDKVVHSIHAGTELLMALSSENSSFLMEDRWNDLINSSISELKIINRYYSGLTTEIDRDSFEYFEDDLDETISYMSKAAKIAGEGGVDILARIMEKAFERMIEEAPLPVTESQLQAQYPADDFKKCLFEGHLSNSLSVFDMSNNLGIIKKYNYLYASNGPKSIMADDFGEDLSWLSEAVLDIAMPDIGISKDDWERYKVDNLRQVNEQCLGGFKVVDTTGLENDLL